MAGSTSARTVVTALIGNSFVMFIKRVAFLMSGSGSMLSEPIHSRDRQSSTLCWN